MTDSDLDLDAIEAREKCATAGPWVVNDLRNAEDGNRDCLWVDARPSADYSVPGTYRTVAELDEDEGLSAVWTLEDAEFIAHAREDIPALIARVRALEAEKQEALESGFELAGLYLGKEAAEGQEDGSFTTEQAAGLYTAAALIQSEVDSSREISARVETDESEPLADVAKRFGVELDD